MYIPEPLQEAIRNRRLIPFAGAGVSMAVKKLDGNPLLPSWAGLLEAAADELRGRGKTKEANLVAALTSADRFLEAAQEARAGLNREWAAFLKTRIDFKPEVVDETTLVLPRAVWTLADPVVVTTNYDRVLRMAHTQPAAIDLWDIEAPAEQSALLQERGGTPTLWYLHGRIDNVSGIILTPDGYARLYGSPQAEVEFKGALATLQTLLRTRTLLFIGFSFSDPALGAELRAFDEVMKGAANAHYAVVHERDVARVRELGLPIEPLPVADFGASLMELLETLAALPRAHEVAPMVDEAAQGAQFDPLRPVFYVPYRPKGSGVIGRDEDLASVRRQFESGHQTSIGQTAYFKGLGGLGKTQLAVEYATAYRDAYSSGVVWLNADQDIASKLIEIAEEAKWVSPESKHSDKLAIARQRVRTFDGGLVVFDNVERLEDIEDYLPLPTATPHLLLTSRVEIPGFVPIELDPLGGDDAYGLLLREAGRAPEGEEAEFARNISDRLGGLPLALELAGSYLLQRQASFEDYYALLERSLIETLEGGRLSSFTKHDTDLASALAIQESVLEEAPALPEILDVLTWSASAPMGLSLMQALLPDLDDGALRTALDLGQSLRILQRVPGESRYAVHRLVAEVRRARQKADEGWIVTMARRLADWFKERRNDFEVGSPGTELEFAL